MENNTMAKKYPVALILLHWLMLFLIVGVYAAMELSELFPDGSDERGLLKVTHFSLGISVLLLVVVRILIRVKSVVPPIVPAPSAKEEKVAVLMHVALYGFMLCMPILGWLIISSHGNSVPFWGIHLPALMGENKELHEIFHEMHEVGATLGYLLIGLHAVAGLLHHYKLKDNTLIRISFLKDKSK